MTASHWNRIYETRRIDEVGWYEPDPIVSRRLVEDAVAHGARSVVDIGAGASSLVDHLLELGLDRIAVVDISAAALATSRARLGSRADDVEWVVADVTEPIDLGRFDVWHDRAVFHFLLEPEARARYVALARRTTRPGGSAVMATFAGDGPERCSGLPVRRYEPEALALECGPAFHLTTTTRHQHRTPSGVLQAFQYSTFERVALGRGSDRAA